MKTGLISFFTAALLGLASYIGNRSFGADEVVPVLFVTGLVAWTVTMYSRKPDPLLVNAPIHLPLKSETQSFTAKTHRLAA